MNEVSGRQRMDGDKSLFYDLAKMFCAEGPKLLSGVQRHCQRKIVMFCGVHLTR
jgi:hypothetical protein